jgi:1-deoxy-D-xylulose-5-phosphate synthase
MDQVIHDIALQNLPVVFLVDRAGLVGADGPTHHGVFDTGFLADVPNAIVWNPRNGDELQAMMAEAYSRQDLLEGTGIYSLSKSQNGLWHCGEV